MSLYLQPEARWLNEGDGEGWDMSIESIDWDDEEEEGEE